MADVQRRRTQLGMSNPGVGEINVGTSGSGSLAQGLLDAATAANSIGTDYAHGMVEDDKVTQANRALRGLMPSENATGGGTRAHMLVTSQNSMNEMTARLKDDAQRWQGTDQEWDQHVRQSRSTFEQGLYQKYPELSTDRQTSKMVTNMLMEQQPNIQATKIGADLRREQEGRQQAFQTRMTQVTANLDGSDLTRSLTGELHNTAKALQMTDAEFEQGVAAEAKARASTGDTRLLMATQGIKNSDGVSLYDRDASIRSAVVQGQRVETSLNQVQLAEDKQGLEASFMSGDTSDADFMSAAANMNYRTGGSAYSAAELNSIRDQKIKLAAKGAKNTQFVSDIMRGDGSLVALEDYSPEEVSKGTTAAFAQGDALTDAYAKQKGYDADQTAALKSKMRSEISINLAKAGFKDPNLVRQVQSFRTLSPDHLQSMKEEPKEMQTVLERFESLPEEQRVQVFGAEDSAFVTNYEKARAGGQDAGQAIDFAQKAGRNITFSGTDNKDIHEAGEDVANTQMGGSWYNVFNMFGQNYPDAVSQQMKDSATEDIRTYRKAGYSLEDAKKQATTDLANNYTYAAGTVIRGNTQRLAERMKVNQEDLGAQFQAYLQGNKQQLEDSAGGHGLDEMYFDIDQKRGIFTVRAGSSGLPVTSAKPLSELGDYKWVDKVAKSDEANKAEYKERYDKAMGQATEQPVGSMGRPGNASSLGESIINSLFPPAAAAEHLAQPTEIGKIQKDSDFQAYLVSNENPNRAGYDKHNGVFTPYDSDTGTKGSDTVGYGHLITAKERQDGFITIGGNPVPFNMGESQMTDANAKKLLQQDMQAHKPATPGWKTDIDNLPGSIQRALTDTSFNMGKNFLTKNPTANEWFKKGDYNAGFIQLLTASNENGTRSKGVLVRRASSYNLANPGDWPRIDKVHVDDDGGMAVKFSSVNEHINPRMQAMIGKDGWMVVKRGKAGSLNERSVAGEVSI